MSNASVETGRTVPITRETNAAQAVNDLIYTQPQTVGFLGRQDVHAQDGVYISPWETNVDMSIELPHITDIRLLPGLRLGAADSQHNVVFGKVALSVAGTTDILNVAVKPFVSGFDPNIDAIDMAVHEHDCLIRARQRGIDTFRPLAVVVNEGSGYLVTQRRDDIETMDNADWTINPDEPGYESVVLPNLRFMVEALATQHASGMFHGDGQPKNIARTDTGGLVVPDLENASFAENPESHHRMLYGTNDVTDSKAYDDVRKTWYALTHPLGTASQNIFLADIPFEKYVSEYEKHYLAPYLNALVEKLPSSLHDAQAVVRLGSALMERVVRGA